MSGGHSSLRAGLSATFDIDNLTVKGVSRQVEEGGISAPVTRAMCPLAHRACQNCTLLILCASLKFLDGRILFQQNEKSLGLTQEKFLPQLHGQLPQEQVYAGIGSDVSDEFKCHIPRHRNCPAPGRSLSTVEIQSATAIFVAFENIPHLGHPGCRIRECGRKLLRKPAARYSFE